MQSNLYRFIQYREDPTCKLCNQQEEMFYVLLYCPLLAEVRGVKYKVFKDYVKTKLCLHHKREWCPVNN